MVGSDPGAHDAHTNTATGPLFATQSDHAIGAPETPSTSRGSAAYEAVAANTIISAAHPHIVLMGKV